jgi:hypothetical protein
VSPDARERCCPGNPLPTDEKPTRTNEQADQQQDHLSLPVKNIGVFLHVQAKHENVCDHHGREQDIPTDS